MPIKKFKDGTGVELKHTYKLQIQSLNNFAEYLGFTLDSWNGNYASESPNCKIVSLHTMQSWHNGSWGSLLDNVEVGKPIRYKVAKFLGIPMHGYDKAEKSKLVRKTKLQYSKRRSTYIVTDHQIELI